MLVIRSGTVYQGSTLVVICDLRIRSTATTA